MFRFEELEIWKRAAALTIKIFDLADDFERNRKYRLAEQLRTAALSVTNNIAEGSGSSSRQEFKQFLNYSHRSIFETANMIMLSSQKSYISVKLKTDLLNELEEISRMVIGFSKSLK